MSSSGAYYRVNHTLYTLRFTPSHPLSTPQNVIGGSGTPCLLRYVCQNDTRITPQNAQKCAQNHFVAATLGILGGNLEGARV